MMQESPTEPPSLTELIDRRTTLQKWLAGLESQRGTASAHVLDRVRADYENRLRETLEALAAQRDGVRAELDQAIERADRAERQHIQTVEALEESRVRNAIGELSDADWAEQRARLEQEGERARGAELVARDETTRLGELLARLDNQPTGHEETQEDAAAWPPPPTDPDATLEAWTDPEGESTDEGFLAEIDRALAVDAVEPEEAPAAASPDESEAEAVASEEEEEEEEEEEDTSPKPGLKCTECGYTNDLSAWFCGVCGADVG